LRYPRLLARTLCRGPRRCGTVHVAAGFCLRRSFPDHQWRTFDRRTGELNGSLSCSARYSSLLSHEHFQKVLVLEQSSGNISQMSKNRRVLLLVLLAGALGVFAWLLRPPREPVYNRRPLSAWLKG